MAKYRNVVSPSQHGPIIINRYDLVIGLSISNTGAWDNDQIELIRSVLQLCTDPASAITLLDVGANIGTHALAFAQFPYRSVTVHAFEAQRRIYYMLAGSIALNSLDNVYCHHKAVSDESGQTITVPVLDYDSPANFGGVELETAVNPDFKGKTLAGRYEKIETARIDDYEYENLRLIKIDVEGMENKVLRGAAKTIARHRPLLFVEYCKTDFKELLAFLRDHKYKSYYVYGVNIFCIPAELELVIKGAKPADG